MPKKVDHHARRTLLADALMRVAARRGLEHVSLRHVAAEAGVTAGMVQHYFHTKDEMMVFALAAVRERVEQRLGATEVPSDASPRRQVEALLVQLLPLDQERELEAHVSLAFQAYAAVKPDIAEQLRTETSGMRTALAHHIAEAQERADATANVAPGLAAAALLSLVEGLSLHVLGHHLTPQDALATLRAQLDLILGGAETLQRHPAGRGTLAAAPLHAAPRHNGATSPRPHGPVRADTPTAVSSGCSP